MNKSKLASWIVAGALALGSGIAMAETAPENPEVIGDPDETTTTTAEDTSTTTVDETTTTTVDTENSGEAEGDETEGDTEGDSEGDAKAHPDNHGKLVSEAAHDHSRDEEFGNHGKYVSSVARGDKANEAKGKGKGGKPAKGTDTADED